jgi:1,2-diacylglycerol 3-alpha-glucosyltransferase
MNILILNSILFTADNNRIPKVTSIKDCMIYSMAMGFKNLGHEVTLAASEEYKPLQDEKYDFEILFFKSYLKKIFQPSVLPLPLALWKYLRKHKHEFDLIISSEAFSVSSFFASITAPGKTVIWQELTAHNNKFRKVPSKIWYNIVVRIFMRQVLIIPRSSSAKKFIAQFAKNVSPDWVDHGVNLQKFSYSTSKMPNFIIVSQLIARKNVDSMISVFGRFVYKWKEYDHIKLFIAGRGEEEPALKKLVADLKLQDKIIFLGFLSHADLNKYISGSYASLINTRRDLNIVSIPESIVSGTPVITNTVSLLAAYINANKIGIAKDDWGEDELKEIIENNQYYVNNCIALRGEMSTEHAAKKMIGLFVSNTGYAKPLVAN